MPKDFSARSASSRLRSAWSSPSFGEARRSASGAKAAAFKRPIFAGCEGETTTPGMPRFSKPRFQRAFLTRNLQQHRIELHERPLHRSFFGVGLNTWTGSEGIPGRRFGIGGSAVDREQCPPARNSRTLTVALKSGEGGWQLSVWVG